MTPNNPHINSTYEEFGLYRKLFRWCIKEHTEIKPFDVGMMGSGPYYVASKNLTGNELVNPEVRNLKVLVSKTSLEMKIRIDYISDIKDPRLVTNPIIMVNEKGEVYRTHGDFHRLRKWVEQLEYSSLPLELIDLPLFIDLPL